MLTEYPQNTITFAVSHILMVMFRNTTAHLHCFLSFCKTHISPVIQQQHHNVLNAISITSNCH